MSFLVYFWILHAVPAVALSLPIVLLGSRRVHWYWWEISALVLPFSAWLLAHFVLPPTASTKGIANIFNEPLLVGLTVPLAALVRVIVGESSEQDQRKVARNVVCGLCVVGVLIHFATPNMGGHI